MDFIFGTISHVEGGLSPAVPGKIQAAIDGDDSFQSHLWEGKGVVLGQATNNNASSFMYPSARTCISTSDDHIFIAAGRIDNASELCCALKITPTQHPALSDHELMRHSYSRWGKECSDRMYGDWVYAVWHPRDRQLVLSRSHYGTLPIYYIDSGHSMAFATSRKALLKSGICSLELDELWLAQYLISWTAYHGERTPHTPLKCLMPGHFMVANSSGCSLLRYWRPEETGELGLPNRDEYVDGFRAIFDEAVNCRLRGGPVAATLSSGLDSGAVTATAARLLAANGQRLTAFTAVPHFNTDRYESRRFGDECPLAKATAEFVGTIDHKPVACSDVSPVSAIRRALKQTGIPNHGAGNLYWLMDILQAAKAEGCNALLTGAAGNPGISWTGDFFSQSWSFLLTHVDRSVLLRQLIRRAKQIVWSAVPSGLLLAVQQQRMEHQQWFRNSAIHPDFALRIRLLERLLHDPDVRPVRNPMDQRSRIFMLGRSAPGMYLAEIGLQLGLDIRDPSADARVVEYVLAVPDRIFMDPKTGIDRWLIREAMKGRLPDRVRLNRKRGLQAADMVPRLRMFAADVEETLAELEHGTAAEYVDVTHMRRVWQMVKEQDTPRANDISKSILLRGIMAGLFVNEFYEQY